ncbi:helix-turn-helix domain-containing protein [Thioclava sp. GXIMD4215]|uniref:helix-turn-helix domain-containing protein n=1 Tax=Thioclava sp. GXIMD4215 TaxID=3131928 RepID=UPI00324D5A20
MEVIDAKWIKRHLKGERGEQSRLADAIGVSPDIVSKIISGKRRVKSEEAPKIVAFFNADQRLTSSNHHLLEIYDSLSEEKKRQAEEFLRFLADK